MKKAYIVKLTTRTRNIRYLVEVEQQKPRLTPSSEQATVFTRKADINEMFRSMSSDYRNQNWEIIEK